MLFRSDKQHSVTKKGNNKWWQFWKKKDAVNEHSEAINNKEKKKKTIPNKQKEKKIKQAEQKKKSKKKLEETNKAKND